MKFMIMWKVIEIASTVWAGILVIALYAFLLTCIIGLLFG
jgi:hypothetical protein